MFFRRKNRLREEYNQLLVQQLDSMKNEWMQQKGLIERSVEPSEEIQIQAKIAEAKYFFLFREAKNRKITINRV